MLTEGSNLPYIPRSTVFDLSGVIAVKISPDAKLLALVKRETTGVMNIYTAFTDEYSRDNPVMKQITHFDSPEIYRYFWADDSKHILFLKDTNGSKSYQLYSINVESGNLTNHTKEFKNITAKIYRVSGTKAAVGINDRNPHYHDIFILDLNNGTLEKIFENDKFSRFMFDENLNLVFKEEIHPDGSIDVFKDNTIFLHFTPEDAFHTRIINLQNSKLYYVDSRGADTTWLKSVDLDTGEEFNLAHDDKSDIGDVIFDDNRLFAYSTTWLKKEWHYFEKDNLDTLEGKLGSSFEIVSQSNNLWIVRSSTPKRIGASFYLYNRDDRQLTELYSAKTDPKLADMIPFEFKSRDGLNLTAYLTLPYKYKAPDAVAKPIPLIIIPHGGPFQVREDYNYNPYAQWLASRGYAVLSVNFRSSSGLGKKLVNAGNGEWGRKMLFDLIDGAEWCVRQGITTKEQVGIMGGSYGGYATLAALTFTPNEFAVGVDIVGPSSLVTVMQKVPYYWDFPSYPLSDSELFFTKGAFIKSMGGSPHDAEGQSFLASRSPLNFANRIERPLLLIHGDNDPIVTKEESLQIFSELKGSRKKACMLSFSNEGHQFRHYANIDVFLAYTEKWLHDTLGGLFEPEDAKLKEQSTVKIQHAGL